MKRLGLLLLGAMLAFTPPGPWAPAAHADELRVAAATSAPLQTNDAASMVPDWAADAIWYQLFPERFRNGDESNDPTRESLEFPENVPQSWTVSPWTGDWYARAPWEQSRGASFYEDGVFDRRYGGDLQGILDKLDYLSELGVNALYLNPVFYARSLHKYDGNTYHHVDPHFGPDPAGDFALMAKETSDPATWKWTKADQLFLELITECHERGIRVVVDGVFNHTGRGFFAFDNLLKEQAKSPYKDWYVVQGFDDPKTPGDEFRYKGWWGVMTLPEFANNDAGDDLHPGPKKYIFDATTRWMDPNGDGDPADGIDGWRLDVAVEVPVGFWADWNAHVRDLNPEAYTVAEHWEDAAKFLAEGGFSATMNYHGFAWPTKGYLIDGTVAASDAGRMLAERMTEYPEGTRYALQNLIDSHDTDRVASMIVNASAERPYLQPDRFDYDVGERASPRNWDRYKVRKPNDGERRLQRMVGVLQATSVGAPMLLYGTEAGMWGADDPCDRQPMVWPELRHDRQAADPLGREREPDEVGFDHGLYSFYRSLNTLRRDHPALRRGSFHVAGADDTAQVLVLKRTTTDETVWVVFNRGSKPWSGAIDAGPGGAAAVAEVFTASGDGEVRITAEGRRVRVTVPSLDAAVLVRKDAKLASDK
ncbi:MAG: glycoside hydrolase family 13 protein [Lacipirellulaceae bacterium]